MVIFHSYVSFPEGKGFSHEHMGAKHEHGIDPWKYGTWSWKHMSYHESIVFNEWLNDMQFIHERCTILQQIINVSLSVTNRTTHYSDSNRM